MKFIATSFMVTLMVMLSVTSSSQNYIGFHKDEIAKRVPMEYKGFFFEKEINLNDRGFVKFVNTIDEQTLLFMFDTQGICTSASRMYNTWLYDQVYSELSKNFKQLSKNKWLDVKNGKSYEYTLIKGKWFLSVTIRPYDK